MKKDSANRWRSQLLAKPFGPSELFTLGNRAHGTQEAIQCGFCGTKHPKHTCDDWTYHTFNFLGRQGVVECCGRIVDILYREWGREFTERRLEDFKKSPLESNFYILRGSIRDAVKAWGATTTKQAAMVREPNELMESAPG